MARDLIRSSAWPVLSPSDGALPSCAGRGCGRTMKPGERLSEVIDVRHFLADPGGVKTRAYLCDACCARLPSLREPDPPVRRPMPPRARDLEPF